MAGRACNGLAWQVGHGISWQCIAGRAWHVITWPGIAFRAWNGIAYQAGHGMARQAADGMGAAVAIPSLVAWSYYSKKVEHLAVEMAALCDDFLRQLYHGEEAVELTELPARKVS